MYIISHISRQGLRPLFKYRFSFEVISLRSPETGVFSSQPVTLHPPLSFLSFCPAQNVIILYTAWQQKIDTIDYEAEAVSTNCNWPLTRGWKRGWGCLCKYIRHLTWVWQRWGHAGPFAWLRLPLPAPTEGHPASFPALPSSKHRFLNDFKLFKDSLKNSFCLFLIFYSTFIHSFIQ